jgi:proline iminopeptidase
MKQIFIWLLLLSSFSLNGQTEYYIKSADGTQLRVQEFGKGQPIIILAGGPGLNAVYVKPIWDSLSLKFRCIVLHQRGTDKSITAKLDSSTFTMLNYVNDLEALRKHLKLKQLTLIGHSWGGMLAMEYASWYPIQVKRIVLLGPGGLTGKFYSYSSDNLMMRLYDEDFAEMKLLDSLNRSSLSAIWPGYFYDRKRALATKAVTDFNALDFPPQLIMYTVSNYLLVEKKRVELIKRYKGPVQIIQGRQDPIGEATIEEIRKLLPQSKVNIIEKCGHMPWLENTEQVNMFFKMLMQSLQ